MAEFPLLEFGPTTPKKPREKLPSLPPVPTTEHPQPGSREEARRTARALKNDPLWDAMYNLALEFDKVNIGGGVFGLPFDAFAGTFHVPDWLQTPKISDIIHVIPRGLQDPDELKRQARERAIAIRQSAIPEWRQQWTKVHTMLDNIEDALVTAIVAGRLLMVPFPRLRPVVQALVAGDTLLNTAVNMMRLPYPGSVKKLRLLKTAARNPKNWIMDPIRKVRPLRGFPTVGETLEILQTTDWLFGVGLQLGPIFGALEENLFRGGRWVVNNLIPTVVTDTARVVWDGLKNLPNLFRSARHLGPYYEQLACAAAAILPAAAAAMPLGGLGRPVRELAALAADGPYSLSLPRRPETIEVMWELGGSHPGIGPLPFPGEPERITVRDAARLFRSEVGTAVDSFLERHETTPTGETFGPCFTTSALNMGALWLGGVAPGDPAPAPHVRVLGELLDRNLTVDPLVPEHQLRPYVDAVVRECRLPELAGIPTKTLTTLAPAFGFRVVPLTALA